jgi:hypothetical protein
MKYFVGDGVATGTTRIQPSSFRGREARIDKICVSQQNIWSPPESDSKQPSLDF